MVKMSKIGFILVILMFVSTSFISCAGSKASSGSSEGESSSISESAAPEAASPEVDEAKQAAEAAEWEAHRLREELNRKNKSK